MQNQTEDHANDTAILYGVVQARNHWEEGRPQSGGSQLHQDQTLPPRRESVAVSAGHRRCQRPPELKSQPKLCESQTVKRGRVVV